MALIPFDVIIESSSYLSFFLPYFSCGLFLLLLLLLITGTRNIVVEDEDVDDIDVNKSNLMVNSNDFETPLRPSTTPRSQTLMSAKSEIFSIRSKDSVMSHAFTDTDGLSMVSLTDVPASENIVVMKSITNPAVLVGYKIFVAEYGEGLITSVVKRKFYTTRYRIRFDDGTEKVLSLKRSQKKGKVPFTLIGKVPASSGLSTSNNRSSINKVQTRTF